MSYNYANIVINQDKFYIIIFCPNNIKANHINGDIFNSIYKTLRRQLTNTSIGKVVIKDNEWFGFLILSFSCKIQKDKGAFGRHILTD